MKAENNRAQVAGAFVPTEFQLQTVGFALAAQRLGTAFSSRSVLPAAGRVKTNELIIISCRWRAGRTTFAHEHGVARQARNLHGHASASETRKPGRHGGRPSISSVEHNGRALEGGWRL